MKEELEIGDGRCMEKSQSAEGRRSEIYDGGGSHGKKLIRTMEEICGLSFPAGLQECGVLGW